MICRAEQLTGFYMMATFAFNEFNLQRRKLVTICEGNLHMDECFSRHNQEATFRKQSLPSL